MSPIVNWSSLGGLNGAPYTSVYTAAKHGVVGATKVAAIEYGPKNIRVNNVCPGPTTTDRIMKMASARAAKSGQTAEEILNEDAAKIPMGRLGEASESAALVCWLASEECSFSTAATFDISGGRTTY